MTRTNSLTHVIGWSHQLLAEVLKPGGFAVDLTAGNGHDTLFLYRRVGPSGGVLSFDIQSRALENTARLLRSEGAEVVSRSSDQPGPAGLRGVTLIEDCHSRLERHLPTSPEAVIANLGYLPGGDRGVTTAAPTTCSALQRVFEHLAPGGRIAVVVYVGHSGGQGEAEAVEACFAALAPSDWEVLRLASLNRTAAPYLLTAQKRP